MQERPVYLLPMSVLLETMRELSANVTLQAQLAALPEGWNEPCLAELVIVQGLLRACTIRTVSGLQLLQQEAAFQMLQRLGALEWTLCASSQQASKDEWQRHPAMDTRATLQKGASPRSATIPKTISQRHKQVLLLLESDKHPEEIARILRLSVQEVEQIRQTLKDSHLISY